MNIARTIPRSGELLLTQVSEADYACIIEIMEAATKRELYLTARAKCVAQDILAMFNRPEA